MNKSPPSRFEYKYRLSPSSYYRTLNAIKPFCRRDEYSEKHHTGRYSVRSLYFDTKAYSAYSEKMEGVFHREKYRLRAYNNAQSTTAKIKVEVKRRIGYLIHKSSTEINLLNYENFLLNGHWGDIVDETLDVFAYNYFSLQLKPTVLVEYQREAFFATTETDLRFSFDHDIRYTWTSDLFCSSEQSTPCFQNEIIFEIKSAKNDIDWISSIIQDLGLVSEPNSKYANGFEHTANDIYL